MTIRRLTKRLSALAFCAMLLAPLAAPTDALASEISCGQNQGTCSCCVCICQCGCSTTGGGGSTGCANADDTGNQDTNEATSDDDVQAEDSSSDDETVTTETDDAASNDETESETTADSSANLRLNELLPNPVGTDTAGEFIELTNLDGSAAQLIGWLIRDGKGKTFALPEELVAADGQVYFPYSQTKLTLVNSGGLLELVAPDGSVRDSISYSESEEGQSFARSGSDWFWTLTPTPGTANVIATNSEDETADTTTGSETDTADDMADETTDSETDETTDEAAAETESDSTEESASETAEATTANVVLSEFLPDPTGDDATGEWIELQNLDVSEADLNGWLLDDMEGGSSPFELDGLTISGGGYLVLARPTTKLALNNDADSVRLIRPDGSVADQTSYDDTNEGESLARGEDGWFRTDSPTPGAENVLPTTASDSDTDSDAGDEDETAAVEELPIISVEQAHDVPNETRVRVSGVVTMPFGIIGQTIFGLRDTDSDYGATIRVYGSDLPELRVGDIVTVGGTVRRRDSGELRIDTSGPNPVVVTGWSDQLDAPVVRLEEIDGTGAGLAVTVSGIVTDTGDGWFILTDDSAEHEIKVELPADSGLTVTAGSPISVRGIVRVQRSVVALTVLDGDDLTVETVEGDLAAAGTDSADGTDGSAEEGSSDTGGYLPFAVVGALGAGGAAYRGLRRGDGSGKKKRA
ncbi:hypothetical protein COY93_01405 [Candidatus Uhrbacteria bacterium CG_4_10_14_0_8_um_filter_58_22]|uniref:LTD domain-containing protein n=1 Tax=Candidatus Uhrbacteria bacterium CG_4_10_14_0_8_um_filter_58_22 TaxID=1975029 RepID=A0A2M7QAL3_9BACT|nr:MAG: hypothetical protein AUJ19_03775 [Parcubacteria group bacterium CG1_02_58_44]PIY63125.1 MAG: hypothetical protein COY93_01405 [Candidatus Uhrbacteria bacterium CG_4_10_14_0_8_um_filter_58_22]